MTGLAITKLDVLDKFDTIKLCVGYRLPDGSVITDSMPDTPILNEVTAIYEEWEGWSTSTEQCRSWNDLPVKAQRYLERIAQLANVRIEYVSVGAEREQMFEV